MSSAFLNANNSKATRHPNSKVPKNILRNPQTPRRRKPKSTATNNCKQYATVSGRHRYCLLSHMQCLRMTQKQFSSSNYQILTMRSGRLNRASHPPSPGVPAGWTHACISCTCAGKRSTPLEQGCGPAVSTYLTKYPRMHPHPCPRKIAARL